MDNTSMMDVIKKTNISKENKEIIKYVYEALEERGYNPEVQLSGYIMTGDPTYITNHKKARAIISRVERDELLVEFIKVYIDKIFSE